MKCPGEHLEAWVRDTLAPPLAESVQRHVTSCRLCAAEVEWLKAERHLFTVREKNCPSRLQLAEMRRLAHRRLETDRPRIVRQIRRDRAVRFARAAASVAAAALLALVAASLPRGVEGAAVAGSSCVSMDVPGVCATPLWWDERVASLEDQFGACLMASPGLLSGVSASCR